MNEITNILGMRPGESVVYHEGYLVRDRGEPKKRTDAQQAVHDTATIAMRLYEQGSVNLVQRRRGEFWYEYVAVRTSRVSPTSSRRT